MAPAELPARIATVNAYAQRINAALKETFAPDQAANALDVPAYFLALATFLVYQMDAMGLDRSSLAAFAMAYPKESNDQDDAPLAPGIH